MYESPINVLEHIKHISEKIEKSREEYIFSEITAVVDVDKDELIKALKYDRDQYNKGYADGVKDSRRKGRWICPECGAMMEGGEQE